METLKKSSTEAKVLEALESLRPFLNKDGGDIELIDIVNDDVTVRLTGNCMHCPMSFSTMKLGVENTIKQFAPEVKNIYNLEE